MNEDEIKKLTEIILEEANRKESNAAFNGGMNDGGAGRLREQVQFFIHGYNLSIPPEWKKFKDQLDPEYQKYLQLKKKFEKE